MGYNLRHMLIQSPKKDITIPQLWEKNIQGSLHFSGNEELWSKAYKAPLIFFLDESEMQSGTSDILLHLSEMIFLNKRDSHIFK